MVDMPVTETVNNNITQETTQGNFVKVTMLCNVLHSGKEYNMGETYEVDAATAAHFQSNNFSN